ncbi:hypothetical protein [Flavobacterium succinicans]|uniref:Uncharacterized protein n=1 Tax=Flavobacterium succinicans TaxID=29536 RepID=A0A199XT93_9FLAO|nr:hypothetical protein [Flavobacterium succinicans]OAZ04865.1 hypothetical protein FLB_07130 [Flavobacterium succinicans]
MNNKFYLILIAFSALSLFIKGATQLFHFDWNYLNSTAYNLGSYTGLFTKAFIGLALLVRIVNHKD